MRELTVTLVDRIRELVLEELEALNEAEGKGCAESEGGPGCIKKKK